MREIGSLPSASDATMFSEHLRGLGISTKLVPRGQSVSIWVHDENRIPQAVDELRLFEQNPSDARFVEGQRAARERDQAARKADRLYRKNVIQVSDRWDAPIWKRCPAMVGLMVVAIAFSVATSLGQDQGEIFQALTFSKLNIDLQRMVLTDTGLKAIQSGEVWRLITPIFLHFTVFHLLFNLMWVRSLGGLIETRKGSLKFLALVVLLAVGSNYGQFLESSLRGKISVFGGLSGVVYGLFGYAWIKGVVRPDDGLSVDSRNVQLMMLWFAICFTGYVGPIANTAHGVGLILGILVALTPF